MKKLQIPQTTIINGDKIIYQIDSNSYSMICDTISSFRTALSHFNTGLANLTFHHRIISTKDCQRIVNINNRCLRTFLFTSADKSLVHQDKIANIISYYQLEIDGIPVEDLIAKLEKDVKFEFERFNEVYRANDQSSNDQKDLPRIISRKQIQLYFGPDQKIAFDNALKKAEDSIKPESKLVFDVRHTTDFLYSTIKPIFSKDEEDQHPIPPDIEIFLLQYLTLVNVLNSIKIIRKCIDTAKEQQAKLDKLKIEVINNVLEQNDTEKLKLLYEECQKELTELQIQNKILGTYNTSNQTEQQQEQAIEGLLANYEQQRNRLSALFDEHSDKLIQLQESRSTLLKQPPAPTDQSDVSVNTSNQQASSGDTTRSEFTRTINELNTDVAILQRKQYDSKRKYADLEDKKQTLQKRKAYQELLNEMNNTNSQVQTKISANVQPRSCEVDKEKSSSPEQNQSQNAPANNTPNNTAEKPPEKKGGGRTTAKAEKSNTKTQSQREDKDMKQPPRFQEDHNDKT